MRRTCFENKYYKEEILEVRNRTVGQGQVTNDVMNVEGTKNRKHRR